MVPSRCSVCVCVCVCCRVYCRIWQQYPLRELSGDKTRATCQRAPCSSSEVTITKSAQRKRALEYVKWLRGLRSTEYHLRTVFTHPSNTVSHASSGHSQVATIRGRNARSRPWGLSSCLRHLPREILTHADKDFFSLLSSISDRTDAEGRAESERCPTRPTRF